MSLHNQITREYTTDTTATRKESGILALILMMLAVALFVSLSTQAQSQTRSSISSGVSECLTCTK